MQRCVVKLFDSGEQRMNTWPSVLHEGVSYKAQANINGVCALILVQVSFSATCLESWDEMPRDAEAQGTRSQQLGVGRRWRRQQLALLGFLTMHMRAGQS
jgi:hypothetical protein